MPACFNTFGTAAIGPIPIILGCTPAEAQFTKRPIGFKPKEFINFSLITITKLEPSLVCEELPAVTEPFTAKAGFNLAKASMVVSALTPSSVSIV